MFTDKYAAKCDKAVPCCEGSGTALTFFDFPAEHETIDVPQTRRERVPRCVIAPEDGEPFRRRPPSSWLQTCNAAAKTWRRLKGENQLPKVVQGVKFQNGIEVIKMPAHHAA